MQHSAHSICSLVCECGIGCGKQTTSHMAPETEAYFQITLSGLYLSCSLILMKYFIRQIGVKFCILKQVGNIRSIGNWLMWCP